MKQAREIADKLPVVLDARANPATPSLPCFASLPGFLPRRALWTKPGRSHGASRSPWGDIAWKQIVTVQSERGESDAALQTAEQIHSGSEKGEALKAVVAALVRADDFTRASRLADSIEKGFWQVEAWLEIAKGQARAGRRREVAEIMARVRQEAERVKDEPRAKNLKAAAFGRLARRKVSSASKPPRWTGSKRSLRASSRPGRSLVWRKGSPKSSPRGRPLVRFERQRTEQGCCSGHRSSSRHQARFTTGPETVQDLQGQDRPLGTRRENRPGILGIEAMSPDGTALETILLLGKDEGMVGGRECPDGTRLAFDVTRGRGTAAHSEVWLLTAGGQRRKVADNAYVSAFSPDGTRLAVYRLKDREIDNIIVDVDTGKATVLPVPKTDLVWDWSPDGQVLAVMAGNAGKVFEHPTEGHESARQVDLVRPDGSGRELLTTGSMLDSIAACFSPDGTGWPMRRDGTTKAAYSISLSSRTSTHGEPRDLVEFTKLFLGDKERRPQGLPCWSPDGKTIVWLVPRNKVQSADTHPELVIITLSNGKSRPSRSLPTRA